MKKLYIQEKIDCSLCGRKSEGKDCASVLHFYFSSFSAWSEVTSCMSCMLSNFSDRCMCTQEDYLVDFIEENHLGNFIYEAETETDTY